MNFRGVVVGITANAQHGDAAAFNAAGTHACLPKPIRMADLFDTLERLLRSRATISLARAAAVPTAPAASALLRRQDSGTH